MGQAGSMNMRWGFFIAVAVCGLLAACDDSLSGGLKKGEPVPRLKTKKLTDVGGDMSKITTYRQPDPRMYQYSLDEALALGKPIVLEFATPGHCTVCDAQLQRLKALMNKYEGQVTFVHMDQYYNPEAFNAYQVKGDPWTFIIDDKGIVRFQRPGAMLYGEFEFAIQDVLNQKAEGSPK
jgi:thiol-disulfide isomerase/thioredoxin